MSTAPIPTIARKKHSATWWIVGAALVLLLIFLLQFFLPGPSIVVSPQTTYITTPLLPDGLPNYEANLREQLRDGVTTENNAAVLMFEALWPSELDPSQYESVAQELGLDHIPSADTGMQSVFSEENRKRILAWLPKPGPDDVEPDADITIGAALDQPWTSGQFPPLAEWVADNNKPLDLLVEASRRPRYYSPSPTLLDNRHDMLIAQLLPGAQAAREGIRGLKLRAMHHIGENRLPEAWTDIMAMYRLSTLMSQSPTMVEQLVAMAMRGMACQATEALLSSDQLSKELARQNSKDLATVLPFANIASCVDQMERLSCLDAVIHCSTEGFNALSDDPDGSAAGSAISYSSVDWNIVLRKVNSAYDTTVAAMRAPRGPMRQQAFSQFDAMIQQEADRIKQPSTVVAAFLSRNTRSDLIGSVFISLMLPAIDAASTAEDRTNSILSLTQLAAALTVYRIEHGAYPKKLEELVPTVIDKIPVDLFNSQPFIYKHLDKAVLLYTTGVNGQDDGGNNIQVSILEGQQLEHLPPEEAANLREKIPNGTDDFSIRLPLPIVKPPAPPNLPSDSP